MSSNTTGAPASAAYIAIDSFSSMSWLQLRNVVLAPIDAEMERMCIVGHCNPRLSAAAIRGGTRTSKVNQCVCEKGTVKPADSERCRCPDRIFHHRPVQSTE